MFDPHRAFSAEITQFFAAINQWQSRFDLDETEFAFFSEVLVGYVGERLESLRAPRPAHRRAARRAAPRVPVLVARARDGLAARVADPGWTAYGSAPEHGSTARTGRTCRPGSAAGQASPSRVATLGRDAVNAVRTLTQNLTRLSRSGVGGSSRRADYLQLARFFDDAGRDPPADLPRIAAAAFGLFPCRHLGAAAGDDTDPVASTTSWWDTPRPRCR